MREEVEQNVRAAHQDLATVLAQWRVYGAKRGAAGASHPGRMANRGEAIMNPAGFWAGALADPDSSVEAIEHGVRVAAAKLRAGDLSFVFESGVGQVAWLSALALALAEDANSQPAGSGAHVRLLQLSMRAQGAAAKLMLSLGALARLDGGDTGVHTLGAIHQVRCHE